MSFEPSYQTQSVTIEEATSAVNNRWFCTQMRVPHNTFESNQQLALHIKQLNNGGGFGSNVIGRGNPGAGNRRTPDQSTLVKNAASNATRVTFESLRFRNPQWSTILDRIISEELERERAKYDGFGSQRGFYTFVLNPVCQLVLARAIVELWARPTLLRTLKTYARVWLENRFAPGGQGFHDSATHFDFLATTCHGCRAGMANQQAHMDSGGCLAMV